MLVCYVSASGAGTRIWKFTVALKSSLSVSLKVCIRHTQLVDNTVNFGLIWGKVFRSVSLAATVLALQPGITTRFPERFYAFFKIFSKPIVFFQ